MKKVFRFLLLLILLAVAAVAGYLFIETDDDTRSPFEFVPHDFIYMVESDRPIKDWQGLSSTNVWQYLKGNEFFADITESADYLDSLLQSNQRLVDLVDLGDLVISAHMISRKDYDFLIAVDLRGKGRKLSKIKPITVEILENLGYEVRTDQYFNIDLYHLYDPVYDDNMTMATVDNVLLFSYVESIIKDAIDQSERTSITADQAFEAVQAEADRGALYNLYLNFREIPSFMGAYTSEMPEMLVGIDSMMSFAALDLDMTDDHIELAGYARQVDTFPSYLSVFSDIGRGEITADEVLPTSTALFTSIGFDDFSDFYNRFDAHYAATDPEGHEEIEKARKRIERLLKIEFERDFFSWMSDEVVTAVVPVNGQYSYFAMLRFQDLDLTEERLNYVSERIGKTAVRFEETDYQGFPIRYLELKGFFKLFFEKLFSKIEKPHYSIIEDYVVFTNDTTSLQYMIDQYLARETLDQDDAYNEFMDEFESTSNVFTYFRTENLYRYLSSTLDAETRRDLARNREYLMSFPQIGFQLYPGRGMYRMYLYGEFVAPEGFENPM